MSDRIRKVRRPPTMIPDDRLAVLEGMDPEVAELVREVRTWRWLLGNTVQKTVRGALLSCINDHGPINRSLLESAAKRVCGQIRSTVKDKIRSDSGKKGWDA